MNSYLLADQFLQHALNALTSFFLFMALTEGALSLFRIRQYRLRALFRTLPPLRLALEPLFWILPSTATIFNASVFSCSHFVQRFLYEQLSDVTQNNLSIYGLKTVSGSLLLTMPAVLINATLIAIATFSLYRLSMLAARCLASVMQLRQIRRDGTAEPRPVFNATLRERLRKQGTTIIASTALDVPLAAWGNSIIMPQRLVEELSQQEYEAVLSHELEHHRWKDTLTRVAATSIAAVYWWIPMTGWIRKLEQEQELASDASIHDIQLDSLNLATALQKTIQTQQAGHYPCAAFARKTSPSREKALLQRLRAVLDHEGHGKQSITSAVAGATILMVLAITVGFVIC